MIDHQPLPLFRLLGPIAPSTQHITRHSSSLLSSAPAGSTEVYDHYQRGNYQSSFVPPRATAAPNTDFSFVFEDDNMMAGPPRSIIQQQHHQWNIVISPPESSHPPPPPSFSQFRMHSTARTSTLPSEITRFLDDDNICQQRNQQHHLFGDTSSSSSWLTPSGRYDDQARTRFLRQELYYLLQPPSGQERENSA